MARIKLPRSNSAVHMTSAYNSNESATSTASGMGMKSKSLKSVSSLTTLEQLNNNHKDSLTCDSSLGGKTSYFSSNYSISSSGECSPTSYDSMWYKLGTTIVSFPWLSLSVHMIADPLLQTTHNWCVS